MPKAVIVQTNFTAGEISPRMYGRTDVVRYNNGAKRVENCIPVIHGGVLRRPGMLYLVPTKFDDRRSRLIAYVFSTTQAYHLSLGHNYLRVLNASGEQIEVTPGTPFELATPWTEAQLGQIDTCHRADTMFLWHPDVPTQRLQRFADDDWRLMPVPWVTEPFDELGDRPAVSLTLSAATVGTGRTATASAATFLDSDVGRTIEAVGGIATITAVGSSTTATVDITYAFAGTAIASGEWLRTGSPQSIVTPSAVGPVGQSITLSSGTDTFRAEDVGKHVVLNGGLVRITAYASALSVSAEVRVEMAAAVAVPPNAWALCRSMWGQEFGYPRTASFHQQRMWPAGSPGFPQSVWVSRLAQYYDFEIGSLADDAFELEVDSDQANPIYYVASGRALAALTTGGEFSLRKAGDGGIKPGNVDVDSQTGWGCAEVSPVRHGEELLFVTPDGRQIRAMAPDRYDGGRYSSPDITALAEHITESGIVDLDAQVRPEPIIWAVRADGVVATCTLDRDNDVVAWARQITDGQVEAISVAPFGTSQGVVVVVRRVIDGAERRSLEMFRWDLLTDSAVVTESGTPFNVITGLDHLEAKTVAVIGDGNYLGQYVVEAGGVTLDRTVNACEIGLLFVPLVEPMLPDVPMPWGSSQGLPVRDTEVTFRVKDSSGMQVNGREVRFPRFGGGALDVPPPLFSGTDRLEQLGYERGTSDMVITCNRPEPFHLLSITRQIEVNAG